MNNIRSDAEHNQMVEIAKENTKPGITIIVEAAETAALTSEQKPSDVVGAEENLFQKVVSMPTNEEAQNCLSPSFSPPSSPSSSTSGTLVGSSGRCSETTICPHSPQVNSNTKSRCARYLSPTHVQGQFLLILTFLSIS